MIDNTNTTDMEEKTRQERSEVFAWLRGGDMTPDPVMEERFIDMIAEAVIEKTGMRRRPSKVATAPLSIKALLKSVGVDEQTVSQLAESMPVPPKVKELHVAQKETEEKREGWEIDSVMVAKALTYIAYTEHWKLSMSQIQMIMYIAYGVWLARKHQPLFDEHPQVWQFGPVFPKVYNRVKRGFDDSAEVYGQMERDYPGQLQFLRNCYKRFGQETAGSLKAEHTAEGTPWMETRRDNPDKLGIRIDDDLIEKWFEKRI